MLKHHKSPWVHWVTLVKFILMVYGPDHFPWDTDGSIPQDCFGFRTQSPIINIPIIKISWYMRGIDMVLSISHNINYQYLMLSISHNIPNYCILTIPTKLTCHKYPENQYTISAWLDPHFGMQPNPHPSSVKTVFYPPKKRIGPIEIVIACSVSIVFTCFWASYNTIHLPLVPVLVRQITTFGG